MIVETLSRAALSAVDNGSRLVSDLRHIREQWDGRVRVRRGSGAQRLMDILLRQPVVDRRTTATDLGISPDNAGRAIQPLVDGGILHEFTGVTQNRMWHSVEVTDALDEFAARAAHGAADSPSSPGLGGTAPDRCDRAGSEITDG